MVVAVEELDLSVRILPRNPWYLSERLVFLISSFFILCIDIAASRYVKGSFGVDASGSGCSWPRSSLGRSDGCSWPTSSLGMIDGCSWPTCSLGRSDGCTMDGWGSIFWKFNLLVIMPYRYAVRTYNIPTDLLVFRRDMYSFTSYAILLQKAH